MSEIDEIVDGLMLELRRGTIVLSVLSELASPMYGYSLVQQLSDHGMPVEANTLYPLLRRLEKQGLLKSEWETSGAKPRKYYVTSELGNQVFEKLKIHWFDIVNHMNKLINSRGDRNEE